MHLQAIVPPLPAPLVSALEANGIKTDTDLLFSAPSTEIFRKLPSGTISLDEFNEVLAQVTQRAAAPAIRGDEYLKLETRRRDSQFVEDMLCGVPELDKIVGGFTAPRVFEISGDRGSGKTALALQVVLRHLSRVHDSAAIWIDTTGDFAPDRVPILLESQTGQEVPTVLERLQVALALDVEAVHEVLESLRLTLGADPPIFPVTRYLVIDTITSLFSPLLSAVSSEGHAIMTTFMKQLRVLADTYSLTILVINTSTDCLPRNRDSAFSWTTRKPALGPSFTFMTETTIWLARYPNGEDEDASVHIAEVFRSRTVRSGTWCLFKIRYDDAVLCSA